MGNRNSLAYRKNADAIHRGDVPEKYTRVIPHVDGDRVLEFGSAEGVLALSLARLGKAVTAIEGSADRHADALKLYTRWRAQKPFIIEPHFINGKVSDYLALLHEKDVLVAVRVIYYFREAIDDIFAAVAEHIPTVVLCGNRGRADAWRAGTPHAPLGDFNRYAAVEGMTELLTRHGYSIRTSIDNGDPIVVGVRG